jgi:hypothetical protein
MQGQKMQGPEMQGQKSRGRTEDAGTGYLPPSQFTYSYLVC